MDPIHVFITAGSSVVGHSWMVWLKFAGGKGVGVTIGVLIVLMSVYNYPLGFAIVLGLIIVPLVLIRNVALTMGISRVPLPFVVWLTGQDVVGMFVIWSVVIGLIIAAKFTPMALASLKRTASVNGFIRGD